MGGPGTRKRKTNTAKDRTTERRKWRKRAGQLLEVWSFGQNAGERPIMRLAAPQDRCVATARMRWRSRIRPWGRILSLQRHGVPLTSSLAQPEFQRIAPVCEMTDRTD